MTKTKKKSAKKATKKAVAIAAPKTQYNNNPVIWIRIELKPNEIETNATIDPRLPREKIACLLNDFIKAATSK